MSKSNFWQLVFNQSRVNGAEYFGDHLPNNTWDWPKDTFLQNRLNELKKRRSDNSAEIHQANREPGSSPNRKRRHVHPAQPNWVRGAAAVASFEGR
ncbi:MAG: hypothetical protein ACREQV_14130 [Candidatus Binatia bacterium]